MPAPADKPPRESEFPKALQRSVKKILDYILKVHIEDIRIEGSTDDKSTCNFIRAESGVLATLKLGKDLRGFIGGITVTAEDASGYAPGAGVGSVENVDVLTFDQDLFEIYDGGGGQCVVKLKTTDCSPPPAPPP